jgi:predicted transcriptional regulator
MRKREIDMCPLVRSSEGTPLQAARDARVRGGLDTDYELYKVIDRKPGTSIYDLAKEMKWSSGKVYGSVRRLERDGWVRTEKAGRTVLKVIPFEWYEFLTHQEIEEFKNMEF